MIQEKIRNELTEAMKARDEVRTTTLRGLLTAFTNELVATKRKPDEKLPDDETITVISRAAKQRKESIEQFKAGGRDDLVQKEEAELVILKTYLPQMMSKDEIEKVAAAKKEELSVTDKSQIGLLMGAVMGELKGKADGKDVKEVIDSLLS